MQTEDVIQAGRNTGGQAGGRKAGARSGALSDSQGLGLVSQLSAERDSLRADNQIGGNIDRLEVLGRIISEGSVRRALGRRGEVSLDILNQVAAPGSNPRFNRAIDWAVTRVYQDLSATQKNRLAMQRGTQLLERNFSGSSGLRAIQTDLRARRDRIRANQVRLF